MYKPMHIHFYVWLGDKRIINQLNEDKFVCVDFAPVRIGVQNGVKYLTHRYLSFYHDITFDHGY